MKQLKELYAYREMIFSLVKRDLKGRYKGSALGFMWTFLNPLLQLVVYTVVFSVIMKTGIEKYYLFLFVTLVPWIFFSTSLTGGASCIWSQKEMVKKIYFPREVLPIVFVTSQFINMLLSFIVIFFALILGGIHLKPLPCLCLPVVMIVEYLLALSVALLTSALTVYFRDLEYILAIISMAWQFLSPVMYSIEQVPEKVLFVFEVNPMTSILTAYREILYYGRIPEFGTMRHAVVLGMMLLVVSVFCFNRLKRHFAEEM